MIWLILDGNNYPCYAYRSEDKAREQMTKLHPEFRLIRMFVE
jgi:hypothetical protein